MDKQCKVISLIQSMGYKVKHESELPFGMRLDAIFHGAKGMFRADNHEEVYLFDNCMQEEMDYVLAHELGHLLSFRSGNPLKVMGDKLIAKHKAREMVSIEEHMEFRQLKYEEELRADLFAIALSKSIGFDVPEWVYSARLEGAKTVISEAKWNKVAEDAMALIWVVQCMCSETKDVA